MQNKKFDQISLEEFDSMNMDHTFPITITEKSRTYCMLSRKASITGIETIFTVLPLPSLLFPSFPQPHMQLTDCFKCITTVPEHTAVIFL